MLIAILSFFFSFSLYLRFLYITVTSSYNKLVKPYETITNYFREINVNLLSLTRYPMRR